MLVFVLLEIIDVIWKLILIRFLIIIIRKPPSLTQESLLINKKNDLENQKNTLKNYCINNNINNYKIISDLGSGLNFKKKGLNILIELIISQSISTLILTYKDRLLRFGNDIIFKLCHIFNIKIVILNNDINKTCEQEFSEDLCEIITVFSARLYGKRSHKNKKTLN